MSYQYVISREHLLREIYANCSEQRILRSSRIFISIDQSKLEINKESFQYLKNIDVKDALALACQMGNKVIVKYFMKYLMIKSSRMEISIYLNFVLPEAFYGGNIKICKYLFIKIDRNIYKACWKKNALISIYLSISNYPIKKKANGNNWALTRACQRKRIKIIKYFIKQGET